MNDYSKQRMNELLIRQAEEAESRRKEVLARHKDSAAFRHQHDMEVARFWVHNSLISSAYLESKSDLLAQLKKMLAPASIKGTRAISDELFEHYRVSNVQNLISIVERDEP